MVKKVCPQKEQPPPGDLIYASQEYLVYEVDGEDHKVNSFAHTLLINETYATIALLPESITIRKAVPRHKISLLRCDNFSILPLGLEQSGVSTKASCGLFQQGEDELG